MSDRKHCEEIGPALAAYVYGEADAAEATAVEAHLEECERCRVRQSAFDGVRAQMHEWEPEEAPRGVNFIGMPPTTARAASSTGPALKALAVAASFVFGLVLTAAAVNLEVRSSEDGWVVRTSLWGDGVAATADAAAGGAQEPAQEPAATPAVELPRIDEGPGEAAPRGVSLDDAQQRALGSWLDQALRERGLEPAPEPQRVVDDLSDDERREIVALIADRLAAQRQADRALWADLIAASENRQQQMFVTTLAGLYESIEAERQSALLDLAGQLGFLEVSHGEELARTNDKLDMLMTLVAPPDQQETRQQEDR